MYKGPISFTKKAKVFAAKAMLLYKKTLMIFIYVWHDIKNASKVGH